MMIKKKQSGYTSKTDNFYDISTVEMAEQPFNKNDLNSWQD